MDNLSCERYLTTLISRSTYDFGHDRENPRLVAVSKFSEGKRTLRVRLAPIGNDKTEYEYRLDEATKTRSRLLRAPLDREKTRIGFMSMILSKFSWPSVQPVSAKNNA